MPKHAERKSVPYQAAQMFDLVADVGRYPEFLPWCVGARVRSRTETLMIADLTIGFGPFRETFTSRVGLHGPERIDVRYENGPFRYLNNRWTFIPHANGCTIDFFVDFEFRNRLLQAAIGTVFTETVRRMVNAFLKRAENLYGVAPDQGRVATETGSTAPVSG
ncbi:type II toxin-antitoxin system RatA family toxin [Granulibacter bethesdensis]|uniref:Polyketide cyclase n=1 Tax=Granulibacter bethesdensis TaxID=364410 RepID=A0AAN0VFR2_9PROT|nr:type II toxin-antitoxin system RatA family toxin [Granulibacter bethesdensis]AHJ62989.1 Polyketide cyclase [Granulibacter bethesdensis]APH59514.1 Polyketide cyclase [Granulibacter bethesdensis]